MLIRVIALVTLVSWAAGCATSPVSGDERLARKRASPLWVGDEAGHFQNPEGPRPDVDWSDVLPRMITAQRREPRRPLPRERPDPVQLERRGERLRVTWLGHSSMLVELDGHLVLTDPVFAQRASPFDWLGPARFHPVPLPLLELPNVDAVLISHDHYDHLDAFTVRALKGRVPEWIVPLGVGAHLEGWGVPRERITELEWWQEVRRGALRIICTPSRHWSGRGGAPDRTLWSSWTLIGPRHRAFFSGDTGPSESHAEIGRRFGPFDLAMVEVGAWDRAWPTSHLGPEGALEAFERLRGRVLLPIHWGTFALGMHAWDMPLLWLLENAGVPLAIPAVGETVDPARPEVSERWCRARSYIGALCTRNPTSSGS